MRDAARTQVYVALRRLRESEHVLELLRTRLLPVAQQQVDAAQAGFSASQTTFVAVIEAERNLRSVELDHMRTQADHDRRQAELTRALGRTPGLSDEESKP
jgi:outer membrane protein TolC